MKRYQECNKIEKLWRRRHYLKIPFEWLWFLTKKSDISPKEAWRIYIGMAQCRMKWTYTLDEVLKNRPS